MKAIQVPKFGGVEVLTYLDIPTPKPNPKQAVVKISAAGVNYIDVYFREGRYPATPPFVLGQEACGVVSETGSSSQEIASHTPALRARTPNMRQCRRNGSFASLRESLISRPPRQCCKE
jgi:NADPH:quinone reductase-like Zn-dependent oxidoreductase